MVAVCYNARQDNKIKKSMQMIVIKNPLTLAIKPTRYTNSSNLFLE